MHTSALELARTDLSTCTACQLRATTRAPVFGRGSPTARIVIVGEAPGTEEDKAGSPFVGAAGRILSDLLVRAELVEADLWITNAVACWPPPAPGSSSRNGKPTIDSVRNCNHLHLLRQLDAIGPRVVVALGAYATGSLLQVSPASVKVADTISVPLDASNPWAIPASPAGFLDPNNPALRVSGSIDDAGALRRHLPVVAGGRTAGLVPLLVGYHPAYLDRLGYWQDKDSRAAQVTVATLIGARRLAAA